MVGRNNSKPQHAAANPSSQSAKSKPQQTIVRTWAFDSVGTRKYALQIKKASNGNPCLKFVEGVPQKDGAFRKFDITIWSEDFAKLFQTLDEVRAYIVEHDIKTPEGHKYDPNAPRSRGTFRGRRQAVTARS